MTYLINQSDEKKNKIRKIVSRCLEMMKKAHLRTCEDKKEELTETITELMSDEEAASLLKIAKSNADWNKNIWFDGDSLDKESVLRIFYYIVLPTAVIDYSEFDKVRKGKFKSMITPNYSVEFDGIRDDFIRYFILWYDFNEEGRSKIQKSYCLFEMFKHDDAEKINKFSDICELYQFAARAIQDLRRYESSDGGKTEIYNNATMCFYKVFSSLLSNADCFRAILGQNEFTFEDFYMILYIYGSGFYSGLFKSLKIKNAPEQKEFSIFQPSVGKKFAEILFSNEVIKTNISLKSSLSSLFFSAMRNFDPDSERSVIQWIAEREVKKIEDLENAAYFASGVADVLVGKCQDYCGLGATGSDEIQQFLLEIFLREKIVKTKWFKELPELFQQLVVVEQARSIFKKAEIVVIPDLPETDIDREKLKKDIDNFLRELAKIAKNGGKPSDYYAGEPVEIQGVADPESYLTSLFFDTAVFFLRDSFGAWKAVKPMLSILRNLKEQAYSIEMKHYGYDCYLWGFVPLRITQFLGSLESEKAAEVCEEWFKHLAGQLKSADDYAINKRKENPEDVPEEFKKGYDITVIEPHPLWREAFCEAAGDLRVNLGFNNCKVFNHLKNNDIDKDVREAAEKTLERIGKINGKFDSGSRKRALLNAWWWYRVAHLKSLGIDFDWVSAQNLKSKEVKINYPKN